MIILRVSKSLAREHLHNLDTGRFAARILPRDVLALDTGLVMQGQYNGPDHRHQKHHARCLEKIDVARVEHVAERLRVGHVCKRWNGSGDRLLDAWTNRPGEYDQHKLHQHDKPHQEPDRQILQEALPELRKINVKHHHHEQEQDHHCPDIDNDENHGEELRAEQDKQAGRVDEGKDEEEHRVHRISGRDHHDSSCHARSGKEIKEQGRYNHGRLPIRRIKRDVLRNFALPAIAVGEQPLLVEQKLFARLGRELKVRSFDDDVHGAGFLAKAAVDALDHIDVVTGGAPRAVVTARPSFDGDGLRRTYRLAQLAGDATLLAVRISPQYVLAAKSRRNRPLFKRVIERGFRLEEIAHPQQERRQEFLKKQGSCRSIEPHDLNPATAPTYPPPRAGEGKGGGSDQPASAQANQKPAPANRRISAAST